MTSSCIILMILGLGTTHSTDTDVIVGAPITSPGTTGTITGTMPVYSDDNVCNDKEGGPQACSHLSDEISMMQGAMRVSHSSNLEALVEKAVQEAVNAQNDKIATWQKELKQENDQLRRDLQHKDDKLTRLERTFFQRTEEFKQTSDQLLKRTEELSQSNKQIQEKLNLQEKSHAELRKAHRLSHGMLLQVCEKGLRGLAQTSKTNVTGIARATKQKFAPDVIDDGVDVVGDGIDAVGDGITDLAETVADLPADVGDWTLDQLENLKSLVGLNWKDIPGLESAINSVKNFAEDTVEAAIEPINTVIDTIEGTVNTVKNFAADAVNTAMDSVTDWVATLEHSLKKVTDYVAQLYDKYLKPIITHIWECAKTARGPVDFGVCFLKPVLEKLLKAMIPVGSVSEKIPFPFDDGALSIDPETGVYTMKQTCPDCVEGDFRDLAPLACEMKQFDYNSIFKLTAHACNIPFMPGQCGGSLTECVKKKAKECGRGALLWAPSGVLSKLSAPVEQALQLSQTIVQNVTHWTSEARALYEEVKSFQSSSADALQDVLSKFMSAVDNAVDSKASVVNCLKAVGKLTSAGSINKLVKGVEDVIAGVEEIIAAIENTQASVEALQTSITSLSSSTEAEVQAFYTQSTGDVQAVKGDIQAVKDDLMQLYENSKGVAEELLEDFQSMLAAPLDQLESLGNFFTKCATARMSYQKVYVDIEVATITAARLSIHERDGIKLAWINPALGGAEIIYEEWPWASLETKEGEELELCAFVYCAIFKVKLRKNPSNILGLSVDINTGLDALKWIELEYKEMFYDLTVIGIPYKYKDPTGVRLPSITLPCLINTDVSAADPTSTPSDDLNVLWQEVVDNKAEAQQIADGQVADPPLPSEAASGNDILEIQYEVDHAHQLCMDADVKAASRTNSGALQELTALSEGEQFVPLVFASGTWLPICGPYFEDDEGGAVLVCEKLGFESGTLHVTDEKFESDAAFVGRVGFNEGKDLDFHPSFGVTSMCTAGKGVGVEVSCTGASATSTFSSCYDA